MCIILVKKRGVQIPNQSQCENAFRKNPDGAGFMWVGNDEYVHIRKGFMTFDTFMEAYESQNFTADDLIVLHFRKASSGGVRKGTCHPFPLSQDIEMLNATTVRSRICMAHNGIFGQGRTDMSDTMIFITEVLADPLIRKNLLNPVIHRLLKKEIGTSRVVILGADDMLIQFGQWHEEGGMLYSNSGFRIQPEPRFLAGRTSSQESLFPVDVEPMIDFKCLICGHTEYSIVSYNGIIRLKCEQCRRISSPERHVV